MKKKMFAEFQNRISDSKEVSSEISFQSDVFAEIRRASLRVKSQINSFLPQNSSWKVSSKKCSKSLDDLYRQVNNEPCCLKRSDTFISYRGTNANKVYSCKMSSSDESNKRIARRVIVNLMMLNAWRQQKRENETAQQKIENLKYKVESFEMQVYVLRQLLNAEKKRVEVANDNIHDLVHEIEQNNKEKSLILKENEELEGNFNKLIEYCVQIENVSRNQENEIITSRLEAENWEKQLEKEREKLKKMESEELFLLEKVRLNDKVIMLKTQQVEQLAEANKELQQKLDVQVPLWDETMAQVDLANQKLKESEVVKNELLKVLEDKEAEIKELKGTIASLEKKLQEEDEKNGLLGKSILEKSNELTLIQKKFGELTKNNYPWSGGIIRMASLCAKIPVACICTIGSLLLPFPSYRL